METDDTPPECPVNGDRSYTPSECPVSVAVQAPVAIFQMQTVSSCDPDATNLPSRDMETDDTLSECPRMTETKLSNLSYPPSRRQRIQESDLNAAIPSEP